MSVEAVTWALKSRVGNGQLKATLVSIACLYKGAAVRKSDLVVETCLKPDTIARHIRLLKFLKFIDLDKTTITLRMPQ